MDQDDPDFSHDPSFSPDDPGFFPEAIQVFITPKNFFGKESKMATKKARGNAKAAICAQLRKDGHKGLAILAENRVLTGQQAKRLGEMGKLIVSGTDVADALSMLTAQFGDDQIDAWALLRLGTEKDTGRTPVALVLAKRILALTDPESAPLLISELIAHAGMDLRSAIIMLERHFGTAEFNHWAFTYLAFNSDTRNSCDLDSLARRLGGLLGERVPDMSGADALRYLAKELNAVADQAQAGAKGDGQ